jgi:hypothetical protein
MPIDTITVFRSGAFTTEPAPEWFQQVEALADQTGD